MKEFIPFLILIALQFVYTLYRAVARRKARRENEAGNASNPPQAAVKAPHSFGAAADGGLQERKNYQEERPLASLRNSLQETFERVENKIQDRLITPTQRAYEVFDGNGEADFLLSRTKNKSTPIQTPPPPASPPSPSPIVEVAPDDASFSPSKKMSQPVAPLSRVGRLTGLQLRRQLKNRNRLKEAFVFQELLSAPVAMRRSGPGASS